MSDSRPQSLCGKDQSSFAFVTIRDRLPDILTKVIDLISRLTKQHLSNKEEEKGNDSRAIIAQLVKLKNEMQTDKEITHLSSAYGDYQVWNDFISKDLKPVFKLGVSDRTTWYSVPWLSCECYLYRRIFEALQSSLHHQSYDPFLEQKQIAFHDSKPAMITLAIQLDIFCQSTVSLSDCKEKDTMQEGRSESMRSEFEVLLEYSLWGNKCDLSISSGVQEQNQLAGGAELKVLLEHILSNDTEKIWKRIMKVSSSSNESKNPTRLDIVLDNSGFEIYSDFCFAAFLIEKKLFQLVNFHVKSMPWFVSDANTSDFKWTIEQCLISDNDKLRTVGKQWNSMLNNQQFIIKEHPFWTYPYDYAHMNRISPDLYQDLSKSDLILFKGDLNYRKLIGDRAWPHDTSFKEALTTFQPAPLCSLRTLKADLVVGLEKGKDLEMFSKDEKWMVNGKYAVVQYYDN